MKTVILTLTMLVTGGYAHATTPCVLPEAQAGGDVDPSVTCNSVDYVQYTRDYVSGIFSPTPPPQLNITCTRAMPPDSTDDWNCVTTGFYWYDRFTQSWGYATVMCHIYTRTEDTFCELIFAP